MLFPSSICRYFSRRHEVMIVMLRPRWLSARRMRMRRHAAWNDQASKGRMINIIRSMAVKWNWSIASCLQYHDLRSEAMIMTQHHLDAIGRREMRRQVTFNGDWLLSPTSRLHGLPNIKPWACSSVLWHEVRYASNLIEAIMVRENINPPPQRIRAFCYEIVRHSSRFLWCNNAMPVAAIVEIAGRLSQLSVNNGIYCQHLVLI